MKNNLLLRLRPSQWVNVGWIIFGIVGSPLIIPPLIAIYKIVETYCTVYDFYEEIIIVRSGVFDVLTRELQYHRIKSIYMDEPFLYRIVGLGNITVRSSDQFTALYSFQAIRDPEIFLSDFKDLIDAHREEKGMKEFELYQM